MSSQCAARKGTTRGAILENFAGFILYLCAFTRFGNAARDRYAGRSIGSVSRLDAGVEQSPDGIGHDDVGSSVCAQVHTTSRKRLACHGIEDVRTVLRSRSASRVKGYRTADS